MGFNKYYLIPAKDVTKALWNETSYGKKFLGRISVSDFFLENGIPIEYQKIVLIVPFKKRLFSRFNEKATTKLNSFYAQEFISEFQFCRIPQCASNDNIIRLTSLPIDGFNDLVSINSNVEPCSLEYIKQFFGELKSKKLIDGYFGALRQLLSESKVATEKLESKRVDYSLGSIKSAIKR